MTTIERSGAYVTLINVFVVEPARARELADLLTDASDTVMRRLPGFRSANIHLSADGTRVVNYAQWDSTEAYESMMANPSAREHMGRAAEVATSFDPHFYTVESVHDHPSR